MRKITINLGGLVWLAVVAVLSAVLIVGILTSCGSSGGNHDSRDWYVEDFAQANVSVMTVIVPGPVPIAPIVVPRGVEHGDD